MSDPRGGVCFGPFLLDPAERLLLRDGRAVPLTPKAFDLLALLVANAGHLLSKDELIEKLWPGTFVEEANLAYNVSAIRKALGEGSETGGYIETVPRRGYRFVGPVAPSAAGAHEPLHARDGASGHDSHEPSAGPAGRGPLWVARTVAAVTSLGLISVSAGGALVFKAPDPEVQLTWFDRRGMVIGHAGEPGHYSGLALSPDGLRAAVVKQTPKSAMEQDVWLFDLLVNTRRQLTFDPLLERSPIWKDDTGRIVFTSGGGGASSVYEMSVGSAERPRVLVQAGRSQYLCDVSRDQRFLLYSSYPRMNRGQVTTELWVQPLGTQQKAEPSPLLSGELHSELGQFSPDGRLVAYVANPAGRREVFVASLRHEADSVQAERGEQVSKGGAVSPRWSPDGRELFYLTLEGTVMAVDVHTDRGVPTGPPTKLFQVPGALPDWGVHPDRTRFLLAVPVRPSPPFEVVLDGVRLP